MFGWEFPPHIAGGLGTACYGLTRGLAKQGTEVIFVVPKAYGDEDKRFVHVVNASDIEIPAGEIIDAEMRDKLTFIHIDSNLIPYVSPEEFDEQTQEIHSHETQYTVRDAWKERYVFSGKYGPNLMEEVARFAMVAGQIVVIEKYGIPAEKVITVHNAVRFETREADEAERGVSDKIVTFLGRITYQKGPDYFVEAAAKVLKRMNNVRFVMAGSGDMLKHIVRRVAKLGIADRFHFTGFLKGDEVQKMFGMSDVYVMPSVSEPFGISPLEAMKSNVPVIISKQSGVAEVLDYALKVDYWDVDALSDAIYGLLQYPSLAAMSATRGKNEVVNLKWSDAARKVIDVYRSAIENK